MFAFVVVYMIVVMSLRKQKTQLEQNNVSHIISQIQSIKRISYLII